MRFCKMLFMRSYRACDGQDLRNLQLSTCLVVNPLVVNSLVLPARRDMMTSSHNASEKMMALRESAALCARDFSC